MASLADNSQQPVCQNCATSTTPLWRRDELGGVLCNACGLFLKLHGRPRPISLKTNVIKSRNRVKAAIPGQRRRPLNYEAAALSQQAQNVAAVASAAAAAAVAGGGGGVSDSTASSSILHHAAVLNNNNNSNSSSSNGNANNSHLSGTLAPDEPISRTGTPSLKASSIAPQHLFDAASLEPNSANGVTSSTSFSAATAAATVAAFTSLRLPSPSSAHSLANTPLDPPPPYDTLLAASNALKTRVSELEVINDLFRGRVSELEAAEQEARRAESTARQAEASLRDELEQIKAREEVLRKRLDDLEGAGAAAATAAAATAAAAAAAAAAITTTTTTTTTATTSAPITATSTPHPTIENGPLSESDKDIDMIESVSDRNIHSAVDEIEDDHAVIGTNSPTYNSAPFIDGAASNSGTDDASPPPHESTAAIAAIAATADAADAVDDTPNTALSDSTKDLDASTRRRPTKRIRLADAESDPVHSSENKDNDDNDDDGDDDKTAERSRTSTPILS